MSARTAILKAVAKALPHRTQDAAEIAAKARFLIGNLNPVRPALPLPDLTGSFIQRAANPKVGATVARIPSLADFPKAVAQQLAASGRPLQAVMQPSAALTGFDWGGAGITLQSAIGGSVGIGIASWGIAETGSLVFHSAPDVPILHNFLPDVHIVAVRASSIVPHLEDYAAAARTRGDPAPRNAILITGASGTTDIEGNLVLGAHGPRELHVIVIDDVAA
jgi:L-lactate dehydrogenase complex protein LldG